MSYYDNVSTRAIKQKLIEVNSTSVQSNNDDILSVIIATHTKACHGDY